MRPTLANCFTTLRGMSGVVDGVVMRLQVELLNDPRLLHPFRAPDEIDPELAQGLDLVLGFVGREEGPLLEGCLKVRHRNFGTAPLLRSVRYAFVLMSTVPLGASPPALD